MTLRVGVDARVLGKPAPTGVARYTARLVGALHDVDGVDPVVFGVDGLPPSLPAAVRDAGVPGPHSGLRGHLWTQTRLPLAARRHGVDVLHAPAGLPPLVAPVPTVATVHDLSPVVHPEWFARPYATLYRVATPLAVRRADHLIAVSRFTRDELRRRYPDLRTPVSVVHNGVTPPPAGDPVPELADRRFLLALGGDNPRKNLDRVADAYRRYRAASDDPAALAVAGPSRDVFRADVPAGEGVVPLGFVDDDRLGWLYRRAVALVYPSLYEGFGLPVLEAMAVGTPVVTADRGATAEVAGDAALLVDPTDVGAIADAMAAVDADPDRRAALAEAGRERADRFDWARTARGTAAVYRRAGGEP